MKHYSRETILRVGLDYELTLIMFRTLDRLNMMRDYYLSINPVVPDIHDYYLKRSIIVKRKPDEQ